MNHITHHKRLKMSQKLFQNERKKLCENRISIKQLLAQARPQNYRPEKVRGQMKIKTRKLKENKN